LANSQDETDSTWEPAFSLTSAWSPIRKRTMDTYPFFSDPPRPCSPTNILEVEEENGSGYSNGAISVDAFDHLTTVEADHEASHSVIYISDDSQKSGSNSNALYLSTITLRYIHPAPTPKQLIDSLDAYHVPQTVHQRPFFSNEGDITRGKEYGGRQFNFQVQEKEFDPQLMLKRGPLLERFKNYETSYRPTPDRVHRRIWRFARPPIKASVAVKTLKDFIEPKFDTKSSQIKGPTQYQGQGFQFTQGGTMAVADNDHLVILSLEVHTKSREGFLPDPEHDPVCAVFYCIQSEDGKYKSNGMDDEYHVGMVVVEDQFTMKRSGINGIPIEVVSDEVNLLKKVLKSNIDW
jgi:hypothetical protein